jgi:hypothetical protein
MIFGIIIGIAIGYFFKPQLDQGVRKLVRYIKSKDDTNNYYK